MIFQFKNNAIIKVDNYGYIECNSIGKNSIIIFGSDKLKIEKVYKLNSEEYREYTLDKTKELVISDLCFFKVSKETNIRLHINRNIKIYERSKLT